MSTIPGIGSKGEKNKSKYKGIDINTLYKGKSVEPQKSAVPRQHGLQSLGKVSSLRRMPPPANLPSLKSENSGNDPSVSLVPSGGAGWGSKEEKKEGSGGGSQPPSSQLQQGTPASSQVQQPQQQAQAATKTSIPSGGQNSTAVRSWSTVTGGVQQGGLVSHQSPLFQEEFPSLAQEEKNKEPTQPTKKEEDIKDTQYGPGPSLRPQNVASWREGGGRAVPQPKLEEPAANTTSLNQSETQQNGPQMSGGVGSGLGNVDEGPSPPPVGPPRPGSGHGLPPSAIPMGPHMGMPPPHPQYRGMMPPYMFGRPPHGGYPPNYPGFARPPFTDPRFRGPPPASMQRHRDRGEGDDMQKRPAIVSEKQLNDFDELLKTDNHETGWAGPQDEIDYSEKLVFSDDEDESKSSRGRSHAHERRDNIDSSRDGNETHNREDRDIERKEERDEDQGPMMVREAWPQGPPRYRGGPRPPHPGMDARGWPSPMHPYDFMGPRGAPPYGFRMPPPQMRPYGPPPPPPPPPPVSSPGPMPSRKPGEDEDEVWRMKRRVNEGEINSAIGRARQRREEEEKRKDSEMKAAAAEKLRQLDERTKKKDDGKDSDAERRSSRTASESSDKDSVEIRQKERPNYNPSQSDHGAGSKGYGRQIPPRFQKQDSIIAPPGQQRQQPPSPGPGGLSSGAMPQGYRQRQGHPPHPWGPYDPRTWGPIPPFMDPRYGPRPPLDMQGMAMYGPPMARRRHDSQDGSANEGQDSEGRHPEQFERADIRAQWMERGYPPHPGHFEDMRRYPYIDQRAYQQERYDFDRREYDRHEDDHLLGHSESDKSHKDADQRPALLSRESFEERNKGFLEKEDRKSERSNSKNSSDWDQKSFKDSKDESFDQFEEDFGDKSGKETVPEEEPEDPYPTRGYRRDGRQGPTPTFRAYSCEERSRREASGKHDGSSINGPPPLLETSKVQSGMSKSSLSSLKRSASNMSSSSAASSDKDRERKSDSPKESLIFERSSLSKKDNGVKQDQLKDVKSQSKSIPHSTETVRPNAWEIKEEDRAKMNKEKDKPEVIPFPKDEEIEKEIECERVDSPFNNRPPVKKKREDERQDKERREHYHDDHDRRDRDQDRYDRNDRPRMASSRGREFVRGRGGSRSRGRGAPRGGFGARSSRNKDYYSVNYERGSASGRGQRRVDRQPLMKPDAWKSDESDENEYPKTKHSGKGDDVGERSFDQNKDGKDHTKDRERQERREPLLPSRDDRENCGQNQPINSWNRDRDNKGSLIAAPPPAQNPWNRESKPLLPLPTTKPDWSSLECSSKEESSSDRNSWNMRQSYESGPEKNSGSHETDSLENRNRRQDNRRDDRDRRRQDRDGGRRERDETQDANDREGGKERFDRNSKDRDRDRKNNRESQDPRQDGQGNIFVPRGEPSKRGRGGTRGGRGGGRYMSAPSGRGFQRMDSYTDQNGTNTNGRQSAGGRDSHAGNYESSNYRRDGRRQDGRNQPPPRFSRTNETRGRGAERGAGSRGRPSRGRGSSAPSGLTSKKPVLTKQTSNDGEEWETASESSEPKNDPRESRDNRKENSSKKNSNQRQFNDRQQNSRRMNNQDSRNSVERRNSNKEKPNQKNGVAPPMRSAANENGTNTTPKPSTISNANHKENVVLRVDGVVPLDPSAIHNAINNLQSKKQSNKKSPEIEPSKSIKTEKEKKDALANIDINNYASVVVIDDQPEVTTDDPNFIFESNEGFQEVTSKRSLKTKKLIEAEQQKKTEKESLKKKDHSNKVVARPKGLSPKTGRVSVKGSKLPPRLAKQREQREKEKELSKNVMPKIELWDNELANNIPSVMEISNGHSNYTATASSSTADVGIDDGDMSPPTTTIIINSKTSMSSMAATPAPTPVTNAWSKPFRFPSAVGHPSQTSSSQQQQQHAVVVVASPKHDKGDQHDSGIDVSDQPNSTSSSTRSSPSADNKLIPTNTIPSSSMGLKVSKNERAAENEAALQEINNETVIDKEISDCRPEPIQMPPSFKDSIFGKSEGSSLQLDFNYDESLAERSTLHEKVETSVHNETIDVSASGPIVSPTSPATEDLSSKIASVKNFWDPMPATFEQPNITPSSSGASSETSLPTNNNSNASPAAQGTSSYHHSFGREVGSVVNVSVGVMNTETHSTSHMEDDIPVKASHSPSMQRLQHSPHPAEKAMLSEVDVSAVQGIVQDEVEKVPLLEPTNVCKVRPQRLQVGESHESSGTSVLSSAITRPLPTVASPPILLANQPTFQIPVGSQFMPQERYTQPSFGFSLSQTQGLGGQHQPPLAPTQQAFSQPSFIVPSTPTQHTELFPSSHMGFQQRNPAFPQPTGPALPAPPPAQPNTIMVSSASSTLMSSNIKAQGPSHGASHQGLGSTFSADPLGKNLGHSQIYSGSLGSTSLPGAPSQQLFYYDPHPQALSQLFQPAPSQLIGGSQPSQNLNNSQIIGSQLLQTRTPVQASSSFFQPAQAVSYFQTQQPSSAVQVGGPIQQVTNGHQFPVQTAFGNQTHGLGLTLQPTGPATMDSGPQGPANMTMHHAQPIGPSLPPTQQHAMGHVPGSVTKTSHFGSVVAAAPQQHQQHQHHHHHTSNPHPPHHVGHGQQQMQHGLGSSRSSQIKSPSQSNLQGNIFNSHTLNQMHSSMKVPNSSGINSSSSMSGTSGVGLGSSSGAPNFNIAVTTSGLKGLSNSSSLVHQSGSSSLVHQSGDGNNLSNRMPMGMGQGTPTASTSSFSSSGSCMSQQPTSSSGVRNGPSQSRFPNPNAPNFPPSNKYSCGNMPNPAVSQPMLSATSYSSQGAPHSTGTGNASVRPQMMMSNVMRGNAPMQVPSNNPRPPFPTPIQRPGSPSASSLRPPSNMMGQGPSQPTGKSQNMGPGPGGNNHSNPGPVTLGNMNLGNSTILSNMILNAASVISQTVGSQLGLHQGVPPNSNPRFPNKGVPGFTGPPMSNRDGPPSHGPRPVGPPHSVKPSGPLQLSHSTTNKPPGSYPGPLSNNPNPNSLKAQQAQQRQAVLTHAANFLNSSKTNNTNNPGMKPSGHGSQIVSQSSSNKDEKKPPLPMVSNPGLVGTSVKIDFSASNNSRAPAVCTVSSANVSLASIPANGDSQSSATSDIALTK